MRQLFLLTAGLWILISCSLYVSAHPGGTDGSGGHTDRSTGEYHYHHGYPAHDHYDMDGDGNVDCPYDFHDNTVDSQFSADMQESENKQVSLWSTFLDSVSIWDLLSWVFRLSFPWLVFFLIFAKN